MLVKSDVRIEEKTKVGIINLAEIHEKPFPVIFRECLDEGVKVKLSEAENQIKEGDK